MVEGKTVFTVGNLIRHLNEMFDSAYRRVCVRGEVASMTQASSGHWYFGLKDESAQIKAVMFRQRNVLTGFVPKIGDQVEVVAQLAVYEQRGDLQLIIESLKKAGQGELFEQFQKLKVKLMQEGLFDADRKKRLPAYPFSLGVVTSQQAAALADVKQALLRRCSHIQYTVYHTAVQGVGVEEQIAQTLARADLAQHDVLILCRGGGSLEDLWTFNTESVVRAVARCQTPIVVGVGHETDVTLAEFAADVRAATPTAAAELISQPTEQILTKLGVLSNRLKIGFMHQLQAKEQRVDCAELSLLSPREYVSVLAGRVELVAAKLRPCLQGSVSRAESVLQLLMQRRLSYIGQGLRQWDETLASQLALVKQAWALGAAQQVAQLERLAGVLEAVSPERTLERGYAYLQTEGGEGDSALVSSVAQVTEGQHLRARLSDGELKVSVLSSSPESKSRKEQS
jgi:exodeoxyribonuclease VII large subunit